MAHPPSQEPVTVMTTEEQLEWHRAALKEAQQDLAANLIAKRTLRDEVAIAVMQGVLSCFKEYSGATGKKARIKMAFEYADEYIKQRGSK